MRKAWTGGSDRYMSALTEVKAWALREVWRQEKKPDYGMLPFIRSCVKKGDGSNPSAVAVLKLFQRIDSEAGWFPGKHDGKKRGPERVLSDTKRRKVAACAMRVKPAGHEPTYARMIAGES